MKGFTGFARLFAAVFLFASVSLASTTPRLSFTLASFVTGDLDRFCATAVKNGASNGFSVMTLVPARVFDGSRVVRDGTSTDDEIQRCLDTAFAAGLDVIYQPHLESDWILYPNHPGVWRAMFDYAPAAGDVDVVFGGFFQWLQKHKSEISSGSRRADVVIAAELETSTTKYAAAWKNFTGAIRAKISEAGLAGRVRVGYDPNWYPMFAPRDCAAFDDFVGNLDFIAPSFYGDWSRMFTADGKTPRGRVQVDEMKVQLIDRLSFYPSTGCRSANMRKQNFWIGEFGIGGDFQHAERADWTMMQLPDFASKRRAVFFNIVDWAKNQNGNTGAVNLWTGGLFDPVGILNDGAKITDAEITRYFISYSNGR